MADIILLRDFQASQIEFWLPTKYLGYDVSSFGRVRSWWARRALGIGKGSATFLGTTSQILRSVPQAGGYRAVGVARNKAGRPKHVSLHRLVAMSSVPTIEGMPHVNHKNCIKADCRSDNLEWTVPVANTRHAVNAGIIKVVGEDNPMAKLTVEDIQQIRALRQAGVDRREVAAQFAVNPSHIWSIWAGKRWAHVE